MTEDTDTMNDRSDTIAAVPLYTRIGRTDDGRPFLEAVRPDNGSTLRMELDPTHDEPLGLVLYYQSPPALAERPHRTVDEPWHSESVGGPHRLVTKLASERDFWPLEHAMHREAERFDTVGGLAAATAR